MATLDQHRQRADAHGHLRGASRPPGELRRVAGLEAVPNLAPFEPVAAMRLGEPPPGEERVAGEAEDEDDGEQLAGVACDQRGGREGPGRRLQRGVEHGHVKSQPHGEAGQLQRGLGHVERVDDLPREVDAERDEGDGRRVRGQRAARHEHVAGEPAHDARAEQHRRRGDEPCRRGRRGDIRRAHGGWRPCVVAAEAVSYSGWRAVVLVRWRAGAGDGNCKDANTDALVNWRSKFFPRRKNSAELRLGGMGSLQEWG